MTDKVKTGPLGTNMVHRAEAALLENLTNQWVRDLKGLHELHLRTFEYLTETFDLSEEQAKVVLDRFLGATLETERSPSAERISYNVQRTTFFFADGDTILGVQYDGRGGNAPGIIAVTQSGDEVPKITNLVNGRTFYQLRENGELLSTADRPTVSVFDELVEAWRAEQASPSKQLLQVPPVNFVRLLELSTGTSIAN